MSVKTAFMNPALDPSVDDASDSLRVLPIGSAMTQEKILTAQSHSTSSTSFQTELGAGDMLLDRSMWLRIAGFTWRITASANNRTVNRNTLHNLLPRAWPLHSQMKSLSITINGNTLAYNVQQIMLALNQYNSDKYLEDRASLSPVFPDTTSNYAGLVASATDPRNPFHRFSKYGRANFIPKVTIIQEAAAGAPEIIDVSWTFTEELQHMLANGSSEMQQTLKRAKQLQVDIQWNQSFPNGCYSSTVASVLDSGASACTVGANPSLDTAQSNAVLYLRQYKVPVMMPDIVSHHFQAVQTQVVDATALNSAKEAQIVSNQIVFGQVPQKLLIFCRAKPDYTAHASSVDQLGVIQGITIDTDRSQGNFSGASQQHLYEMSKRNGLNSSWVEWSLVKGGPVCISIENGDLGGYVAGSNETFSFNFKLQASPISTCQILGSGYASTFPTGAVLTDWQCVVVAFFSKQFVCAKDEPAQIFGGVSKDQLMKALAQGEHISVDGSGLYTGGGLLHGGSWGSFWRGVKKVARTVLPIASAVAPAQYKPALGVASSLVR